MNRYLRRLIYDFQFMTRIPINISVPLEEDDPAEAMIFFPVVALVIGGLSLGVAALVNALTENALVAALGAVALSAYVSGGLHLDGLSDVCDGLFSGRDRERVLEIMHDSRMGTFGGAGLFFALSAKMVFLSAVFNRDLTTGLMAALAAPLAGRAGILMISKIGKSARAGMGRCYVEGMNARILSVGLLLTLLFTLPALKLHALAAILIPAVLALLLNVLFNKRLGGITGDCLGCTSELSEICFLFYMALKWVVI